MWARVDEDVAVPKLGMEFLQRIVLAIEDRRIHVRRAEEATVEAIRPTMVRALNPGRETSFGSGAQTRTTMPADVVKGAYRAGIGADYDDAFAGDLPQEIIAWVGDVVGAARADPAIKKEVIQLPTEQSEIR